MEYPRLFLYIGALMIVISIFWTFIIESRKESILKDLISKGLPTPAYANVFELQNIANSN